MFADRNWAITEKLFIVFMFYADVTAFLENMSVEQCIE